MEKLQSLLEKFIQSDKEHGIKQIAESELFFDTDYEEMDAVRAEFMQQYELYKTKLAEICGKPIVEDINAHKFSDFKLSKNEKIADIITLYNYKNHRFGILVCQEDKELPIELCLTAFKPNAND